MALAHFISNLSALIIGLALFSGALLFVLRRSGLSLQPALRWEPAVGWAAVDSAPPPAAGPGPTGDGAAKLDLGPTYAEEKRRKEEEARDQEEALLRHLAEQNFRLREQIDELGAAGE
jgi:hypothetical protein